MEGNGNGYHREYRDADARGIGGSGTVVRDELSGDAEGASNDAAPSTVRSRIAELREAALLARAIEPQGVRRLVLDAAFVIGWSPSEIERLTFGEYYYIVKKWNERQAALRGRHGTRR
jgi:hypothetical protein